MLRSSRLPGLYLTISGWSVLPPVSPSVSRRRWTSSRIRAFFLSLRSPPFFFLSDPGIFLTTPAFVCFLLLERRRSFFRFLFFVLVRRTARITKRCLVGRNFDVSFRFQFLQQLH